MESDAFIRDVSAEDFETVVLQGSQDAPVVVDFWAEWCGPCRQLGPLLEALAREHAGAFILAKVDVDSAQSLAQQFGVRSIPTVLGFRDGTLVAEFEGAQSESVVRKFLEALLPGEADQLAVTASERAEAGDLEEAESDFRQALELDGRHPRSLLGLARVLAGKGETTEAQELLDRIVPSSPLVVEAEQFAAELRTRAGQGVDPEVDLDLLRQGAEDHPDDLSARLELGRGLAARGDHEEAFTVLLEVVKRDSSFEDEAARRLMVDLFAVLGSDHPLTERFRSELARVLFR